MRLPMEKDKMTVGVIDQAPLLSPQPAFDLNLIILRAAAVFTGVVPHAIEMTVLTDSHMTAELGRATVN